MNLKEVKTNVISNEVKRNREIYYKIPSIQLELYRDEIKKLHKQNIS